MMKWENTTWWTPERNGVIKRESEVSIRGQLGASFSLGLRAENKRGARMDRFGSLSFFLSCGVGDCGAYSRSS